MDEAEAERARKELLELQAHRYACRQPCSKTGTTNVTEFVHASNMSRLRNNVGEIFYLIASSIKACPHNKNNAH